MKSEPETENRREPYRKPELRVVELAAEEVLATGCKLAYEGMAHEAVPCAANNCAIEGS